MKLVSQIRKYCAPETFTESLERYTLDTSQSLTITRIVRVALYCIGLIPAMILDLAMRKKSSSLSRLLINQTVYQLTLAKNALVGMLPKSLQKNWESLAVATVILAEVALTMYLCAPNATENTFLTVNNALTLTIVATGVRAVTKLISLKIKEAATNSAAAAKNAVIKKLLPFADLLGDAFLAHFPEIGNAAVLKRTREREYISNSKDWEYIFDPIDTEFIETLEAVLQKEGLPQSLRAAAKEAREIASQPSQAQLLESFATAIEDANAADAILKAVETARYTDLKALNSAANAVYTLVKTEKQRNEAQKKQTETNEALLEKLSLLQLDASWLNNFPEIQNAVKDVKSASVAASAAEKADDVAQEKVRELRAHASAAADAANAALQKLLQKVDLPQSLRSTAEIEKDKKTTDAPLLESFAELIEAAVKADTALQELHGKAQTLRSIADIST